MSSSNILVREKLAVQIRLVFDQIRSRDDENCAAQAIHVVEGPQGAWDIFLSCSINHDASSCGERTIVAWIFVALAGKQLRRVRKVTVELSDEGVQGVTNAAVDVVRRMFSLTVVERVKDGSPE